MPGRLSGVLGEELKIGNYYLGFYFFCIAAIFTIFKKNNLIIIISIFFFTVISFLIGERANFLRVFFGIILFLLLLDNFKIKYKIYTAITIISFIALIFNLDEKYKSRFYNGFIKDIYNNGISTYFYNTQYGAHFSVAYKIFKNYPISGTGIKNFYFECTIDPKKYEDKRYVFSSSGCSTHPHQLHLEILSQVGIFGYIVFLFLFFYFFYRGFINYKKNKNIFHLSGLIFIFVSIFSLLPSGSFFTTYGATIFWLNIGLTLAFEKISFKKM